MMRSWLIGVAMAAVSAPAVAAVAQHAQEEARAARLSWMQGCWQRSAGARVYDEQWMAPRGGVLLGMSRNVRNDTVIEYEQLRIYERAGALVYAAMPSGQKPAEFVSTEMTDSTIVFANPEHDFPQRILYRRAGGDSLHARVEGLRGGQMRGSDFRMGRVSCDAR